MLPSPKGRNYYWLSDVDIGFGEEWLAGSRLDCYWISRSWFSKLSRAPGSGRLLMLSLFCFSLWISPPHLQLTLLHEELPCVHADKAPLSRASYSIRSRPSTWTGAESSFSGLCQLLLASCARSGSPAHPASSVSRKPAPASTPSRHRVVPSSEVLNCPPLCLHLWEWSSSHSLLLIPAETCPLLPTRTLADGCPLTQFWTQLLLFWVLNTVSDHGLEQKSVDMPVNVSLIWSPLGQGPGPLRSALHPWCLANCLVLSWCPKYPSTEWSPLGDGVGNLRVIAGTYCLSFRKSGGDYYTKAICAVSLLKFKS